MLYVRITDALPAAAMVFPASTAIADVKTICDACFLPDMRLDRGVGPLPPPRSFSFQGAATSGVSARRNGSGNGTGLREARSTYTCTK